MFRDTKIQMMVQKTMYIPKGNHSYIMQLNERGLKTYHCGTSVFKCSFFPYTISKWNKLDLQIRKANSVLSF